MDGDAFHDRGHLAVVGGPWPPEEMIWYEAYTLQCLEPTLTKNLRTHIQKIVDSMATDFCLFDSGSSENANITHEIETGHENVSALLRQLVRLPAPKGEEAFSQLCLALRKVAASDGIAMAEELEKEAQMWQKGENVDNDRMRVSIEEWLRSGSPALNDLNREDSPQDKNSHVDGYYGKAVSKDLRAIPTAQAQPPAPEDFYHCVSRYEKRLLSLCKEMKSISAFPGLTSRRNGRCDVTQIFSTIRVLSREEAKGYSDTCTDSLGSHASQSTSGETHFPLHNPVQLLRENAADMDRNNGNEFVDSCLLQSPPGGGKTTLCQMIMAEFAGPGDSELKRQFRFPIYIQCRDQKRLESTDWCTVLGLNDKSLHFTDQQRDGVFQYLLDHSEKMLFIIDGVDEAASEGFLSESSALVELIRRPRSTFIDSCVFITGRPCRQTSSLACDCNRHYTLAGFSTSQLNEFYHRRLGNKMAKQCINELSQPGMEHIKHTAMTTPLVATIICELYATTSKIPSSIAQLYMQFVVGLTARLNQQNPMLSVNDPQCTQRTDKGSPLASPASNSPESVLQTDMISCILMQQCGVTAPVIIHVLNELGEIALDELMQRRFAFPASIFSPRTLEIGRMLGILTFVSHQQDPFNLCLYVSFLHLTFQEFFAARCVALSDNPLMLVEDMVKAVGVRPVCWPFWRSLCGIIQTNNLEPILTQMQQAARPKGLDAAKLTRFLLTCLLEHRQSSRQQSSLPNRPSEMEIQSSLAAAAISLSAKRLDLANTNLSDVDILALECVLELLPSVPSLHLRGCSLSLAQIQKLQKYLHKAVELNLLSNDLHGEPIRIIAASLLHPKCQVENLLLGSCQLRGFSDGYAVSLCMQAQRLQSLWLADNTLNSYFMNALSTNMAKCRKLVRLHLQGTRLSAGCGPSLATIVSHCPLLTKLYLTSNKLVTTDAECILTALQGLPKLEVLWLNENLIDDQVYLSLQQFFVARRSSPGSMPACEVLIHGNRTSVLCLHALARCDVVGADKVVDGLSHVTESHIIKQNAVNILHMKKGNFYGLGVGDKGVAAVAPVLAADTVLRRINFGSCQITSSGLTVMAHKALLTNTTMEIALLPKNRITIQGVNALLQVCSSANQTLKGIDLTQNPIFETSPRDSALDCAQRALSLLQHCQHLQCILLAKTNMEDENAVELLHAIRGNHSLKLITLDDNHLGDATAAMLAEVAESNSTLKYVGLSKNRITDQGIELLLTSMSVREMSCVWLKDNPCSTSSFRFPLMDAALAYNLEILSKYVA